MSNGDTAMSNKKNAIMLADTRPALVGHMLLQIKNTNCDNFDEIIIMDTGLDKKDKDIMQKIMPCRFISYRSPFSDSLLQMEKFKRFSLIMFARYEMFRLLDEYSLIMWIDTDMVLQGSFAQLLEDSKNHPMAILREDPINKSSKNVDYMRTNFFNSVAGYNMQSYLCCTGTIIVRDTLKQTCDYTKWCYDKTLEWADNLNLPDQGVINALIQNFNIDIYPIGHNGTYGCFPYSGRDCSKAISVHSWGSNKFWNSYYLNRVFPVWEETYQKWLSLGGSVLTRPQIPQVSVVIPVYKPDLGYFKQCIDSLLFQKLNDFELYTNFEVIIVSEPFNQAEIEKFVSAYGDVRLKLYFNTERMGIAASLNRGMKLAQGKYIARLDDDDISAPCRLQKQVEYLEKNDNITLCTSDYLYFGDMNDGRVAMEGEMAKAWSVLTCPFDHPTIMFRKDFFFQNNLFYDENRGYVEDWELWKRAFQKGMTVGCIHDILLYHRWHTGSAGQTNQTVIMMREMVKSNFVDLGMEIPDKDISLLLPWSGKVNSEFEYTKLENYFRKALENNSKIGIYDSFALSYVFSLRLMEARSGQLDAITIKRVEEQPMEGCQNLVGDRNGGVLKNIKSVLKKCLKPLYQPFRHRYEDRLLEMMRTIYTISDQLNHLQACIEAQEKKIEALSEQMKEQICYNTSLVSKKIDEDTGYIRQAVDKRVSEEGKNTRQMLSKKVFEESENTRQQLSAKVFEESENTRQQLSAKVFEESENTRQFVGEKIYKENQSECTGILDEIHRHIDFTYRDILVALEKQASFLPQSKIKLISEYPVAYESLDHLYPHGTIRDNTRYPRFVEKCEEVLGKDGNLSFLDLGCSGGGMVLEAALRGHISMGLEGSDSSKKEQRAEWRLLGDRLQTCDITKPFHLIEQSGTVKKFDIITAWEVMEHIQEKDLPQMLENIKQHLSNQGYFIASIANWEDIDPQSGINWHVTLHEYDWWVKQFENAGFEVHNELFQPIDMARGTYNPPHCYEKPYSDYNREKNFYIVVSLAKK